MLLHAIAVFLSLLLAHPLQCAAIYPSGHLQPLLHGQGLSHFAFHSVVLKRALAHIFAPGTGHAAAVVGVEWGDDVVDLARLGFHVYAFEPLPRYVSHMRDLLLKNPDWNVTLVPIAAGDVKEGTVSVQYGDSEPEIVERGIVDDHVKEPLAVYSLDIQGGELDVLKGSSKILSHDIGVRSLWIEAIACNEKVKEVLSMLDEEYVLFDFAPWGKLTADTTDQVPHSRASFVHNPDRPSEFSAFWDWMCGVQTEKYQWLQTDLIAIRRDYLSHAVVGRLASLADDFCDNGSEGAEKAKCLLKGLLSGDNDTAKEDL